MTAQQSGDNADKGGELVLSGLDTSTGNTVTLCKWHSYQQTSLPIAQGGCLSVTSAVPKEYDVKVLAVLFHALYDAQNHLCKNMAIL